MLYTVIMAGGRGERFWPLSTASLPKPFIPLLGSDSLLKATVARIQPLVPYERIMISIGAEHFDAAREQLPEIPMENFLVEPLGRDTSACLGFCALHLDRRDKNAVMLALPADHYVADGDAYRETIRTGIDALEGSNGVVFGIMPTRPESGYGYILVKKTTDVCKAWPVARFVEKPDVVTAARYLADGNYYWNSGMFLWNNRTLLGMFEKFMPETFAGLKRLHPIIGDETAGDEIKNIFSTLPRISIDFGIMEKMDGLRLVPAGFGWDDIGSWSALGRALTPDANGNIIQGRASVLETENCIIYSQSDTIAAFGVSDLVIVQAYGKILVTARDKAADLKKLITMMERS